MNETSLKQWPVIRLWRCSNTIIIRKWHRTFINSHAGWFMYVKVILCLAKIWVTSLIMAAKFKSYEDPNKKKRFLLNFLFEVERDQQVNRWGGKNKHIHPNTCTQTHHLWRSNKILVLPLPWQASLQWVGVLHQGQRQKSTWEAGMVRTGKQREDRKSPCVTLRMSGKMPSPLPCGLTRAMRGQEWGLPCHRVTHPELGSVLLRPDTTLTYSWIHYTSSYQRLTDHFWTCS